MFLNVDIAIDKGLFPMKCFLGGVEINHVIELETGPEGYLKSGKLNEQGQMYVDELDNIVYEIRTGNVTFERM